jgi:hypothetical protein
MIEIRTLGGRRRVSRVKKAEAERRVQMPIIEIDVSVRLARHLAAVRLMSYMVFPDDPKLRVAAEITFRTILADWYSDAFAKKDRKVQRQVVKEIGSKLGEELSRALVDPSGWMRKKLFYDFLRPAGGTHAGAVALTSSPSSEDLDREWTRRWWSIVYTGKILALIGSIDQHHQEVGASVNKAIHILCETEGNEHIPGFPGVYESSLKKAWAKFKSVAHLCAAYITTETRYYDEELSRDFWEYWKHPPAFYDDETFKTFCLVAKSAESFATSFFPRGQRQPLISREEIFALPEDIFESGISLPPFRALTDEERAALKTYRAPKQFV